MTKFRRDPGPAELDHLEVILQNLAKNAEKHGGVVFVTNSLTVGGSEHKTVQLANALSAKGTDVVVASLNEPDTLASAMHSSVSVVRLDRRGRLSIAVLRKLVELIRLHDVTALVAVNLYPCLYCYLAAMVIGRRSLRLVASLNTTAFSSRSESRKMQLYAWVLRRFDLVLFGAESQRQLWSQSYGIGRHEQATEVLYNGVDTHHFARNHVSAASIPGWPDNRLVIGSVGQFRSEKRQGDVLRAAAELRRAGLDVGAVLVGGGKERPALERLIGTLQISDAVALVGEQRDVRPFLAMMDVFVLPSVETFSNAALEAMSMSCPVVATTAGGMPEMLRDGGGLLCPPGDVDSLVGHVGRLLRDSALRKTTGDDARNVVERRFSHEAMIAQFDRSVFDIGV